MLADQLTELIGAVAICLLPPGPSSPSLSTSSAAACGQGLLPLSVTDATACSVRPCSCASVCFEGSTGYLYVYRTRAHRQPIPHLPRLHLASSFIHNRLDTQCVCVCIWQGGMSLSLMRRFRMVQAVEVDDDRIQDLRHNIQAVLDHHPALEQQSVSANASTSGATKASCAVCASHSESCAAAATAEAGEGAKSRGWECGQVFSYHADYTQLSCSLQQDLVVIDPPWGGTGYRDRRACESGSRGESDMQFGRLQLSQVASHLLYFHAPLLMLRLPSTFDCKEFTAALSECRHVCPLSHAHTHQRCPEPGAGAVKVYDMEVRYGRTKVLLLARLPIDASLHDSTIRALRQALAQLALTSYGAQQDIDREMEIVSKGLDACHLPHTAQQTTPRPVEPHYKPHPPQQTTNDKEPSSSSSSSRRKLLYRLGRMPRLIAAPEYLSSAGRSKIDESLQGLKLAV